MFGLDKLFLGIADFIVDGLVYVGTLVIWLLIYGFSIIITFVEKAFFLFAGLYSVGYTKSDGTYGIGSLISIFTQNARVVQAYLGLSLIAFIVMLVLAILKIVKQDYIDKEGPRSKAPIFRSLAISFILYIAIPPLFMILTSVSSILALSVYRAFGGGSELVADMLLKLSFGLKKPYDATWGNELREPYELLYGLSASSFTEIHPNNLFYGLYYVEKYANITPNSDFSGKYWKLDGGIWENYGGTPDKKTTLLNKGFLENIEFYWYSYFIGAFIVAQTLFAVALAMVKRLYKILVLYVVAPAPIARMVEDDGAKFKRWKEATLGEFLKVLGAILSFMIFIMIVGIVNSLDFTSLFLTTLETAGNSIYEFNSQSIGNGVTTQNLSLVLSSSNGFIETSILWAFDAFIKVFLIIGGAGVVKEADGFITELITGLDPKSAPMGINSLDDKGVRSSFSSTLSGAKTIGTKAASIAAGVAAAPAAIALSQIAKGTGSENKDKDNPKKDDDVKKEVEEESKKGLEKKEAAMTPENDPNKPSGGSSGPSGTPGGSSGSESAAAPSGAAASSPSTPNSSDSKNESVDKNIEPGKQSSGDGSASEGAKSAESNNTDKKQRETTPQDNKDNNKSEENSEKPTASGMIKSGLKTGAKLASDGINAVGQAGKSVVNAVGGAAGKTFKAVSGKAKSLVTRVKDFSKLPLLKKLDRVGGIILSAGVGATKGVIKGAIGVTGIALRAAGVTAKFAGKMGLKGASNLLKRSVIGNFVHSSIEKSVKTVKQNAQLKQKAKDKVGQSSNSAPADDKKNKNSSSPRVPTTDNNQKIEQSADIINDASDRFDEDLKKKIKSEDFVNPAKNFEKSAFIANQELKNQYEPSAIETKKPDGSVETSNLKSNREQEFEKISESLPQDSKEELEKLKEEEFNSYKSHQEKLDNNKMAIEKFSNDPSDENMSNVIKSKEEVTESMDKFLDARRNTSDFIDSKNNDVIFQKRDLSNLNSSNSFTKDKTNDKLLGDREVQFGKEALKDFKVDNADYKKTITKKTNLPDGTEKITKLSPREARVSNVKKEAQNDYKLSLKNEKKSRKEYQNQIVNYRKEVSKKGPKDHKKLESMKKQLIISQSRYFQSKKMTDEFYNQNKIYKKSELDKIQAVNNKHEKQLNILADQVKEPEIKKEKIGKNGENKGQKSDEEILNEKNQLIQNQIVDKNSKGKETLEKINKDLDRLKTEDISKNLGEFKKSEYYQKLSESDKKEFDMYSNSYDSFNNKYSHERDKFNESWSSLNKDEVDNISNVNEQLKNNVSKMENGREVCLSVGKDIQETTNRLKEFMQKSGYKNFG